MHIVLVGLSHKTAPLEVRERVSFPKERLPGALEALADQVGEGVILWTCNRTEVYTVSEEPERAADHIRGYLAEFNGLDPESISPYLFDRRSSDAVRHLFRVASGLDSMILGESQVLGQVREALTAASRSHTLRVPVSRLFHRAIRTGRSVREQTDLGRHALSVSYAGVELAERVLGSIRGLRVLLLGAGEAGKLVARALRTGGASDLVIANRTYGRAEEVARQTGGRAVPYADVGETLMDVDVAIAATEAPQYVITRDMAYAASEASPHRARFLLDLSVPRNIDPESASVDGVSLFNIDDLSDVAEENLEARRASAGDAERLVDDEVERFMSWWESLYAVPLIRGIHTRADGIRQRELERALRRLDHLTPEEVEVLDALTRSIVSRLLHDPTMALKAQADPSRLEAARELFGVWDNDE